MAVASNKKSEQAVLTRRMRPVYDAIDAGQNKRAVQEADKILKKHPDTGNAKALKALALIRLERIVEARPLIDSIENDVKNGNFEENTLLSLCHCYKELRLAERIVKLYEVVISQPEHKSNETYLTNLFLAHARLCHFKEQQKIAMQMYKEFNNVKYYFWAVISVFMQGFDDAKLGESMYLPLAERMLEKITDDQNFRLNNGIDLRFMVMEARKNYTKAIDCLENEPYLSSDTVPGTLAKHHLNYLYREAENHPVVIARTMDALEAEYNDWDVWTFFFDAAFASIENGRGDENRENNNQQEMINRMVEIVQRSLKISAIDTATDQNAPPPRGPSLARLELIQRLLYHNYLEKSQLDEHPLGSLLSAFIHHVDQFYTKPFCFHDLSVFLHLLDRSTQHQFLTHLLSLAHTDSDDSSADDEQYEVTDYSTNSAQTARTWAELLYEQTLWCFRLINMAHIDNDFRAAVERLLPKVSDLTPMNCNFTGQQEIEQKRWIFVAVFTQMMVFYLWEYYVYKGDWRIIFTTICMLEEILDRLPSCSALAIYLIRLYPNFGVTERVSCLCQQIQIKNIQRDSLAYFQFFLSERYGRFKTTIFHYTSLGSMFDQNEREVADCIQTAYRNLTFQKVPKLVDFLKRCTNSLFAIGSDVLNRLFSACFAMDSFELAQNSLIGDDEPIDWSIVGDNRDFTVMPSIILPKTLERIKQESFAEIKACIRLKHLLCRAIGLISFKSGRESEAIEAINAFINFLAKCARNFPTPTRLEQHIVSFNNVNLHQLLSSGHLELPVFMLKIALIDEMVHVRAAVTDSQEQEMETDKREALYGKLLAKLPAISELVKLLEVFRVEGPKAEEEEQHFWTVSQFLSECAAAIETLTLSLFACKFLEQSLPLPPQIHSTVAVPTKACPSEKKKSKDKSKDKSKEKEKKDKEDEEEKKSKSTVTTSEQLVAQRFVDYQLAIFAAIVGQRSCLSKVKCKYSPISNIDDFFGDEKCLKNIFSKFSSAERGVLSAIEASHKESVTEMLDSIAHVETIFQLGAQLEKLSLTAATIAAEENGKLIEKL